MEREKKRGGEREIEIKERESKRERIFHPHNSLSRCLKPVVQAEVRRWKFHLGMKLWCGVTEALILWSSSVVSGTLAGN